MGKYSAAAKKAREATAKEHAAIISGITSLKEKDIRKLFPKKADREKLADLIAIINASTDENKAAGKLIDNIDHLAGTVVKLIKFAV